MPKLEAAQALYRDGKSDEAKAAFAALFDRDDAKRDEDFLGRLNYGRILFQEGETDHAAAIWADALRFARSRPTDLTEPNKQEVESGPGYVRLKITVPSVVLSGTVNFKFAEGASVYNAVNFLGAFKNPGADWNATAIVARSLTELGLGGKVIDLVKQGLQAEPDNGALLEAAVLAARAVQDGALEQAPLARLKAINPNHRLFAREKVVALLKG